MAVELITGVGASDHISSNDFRAFNRANFGQGRYILNDADNMEVNVSAPAGIISISEGSCLWSGMHIRLSSVEKLSYVVPSSGQFIGVYLHYTKDASTGVESVDFEVKQGIKLSSTIDNLGDNTVDAYTLFCSFIAYPTTADNFKVDFKTIKSHEELKKLIDYAHEEVVLFEGSATSGSTILLSEEFNNFHEICFVGTSARHQMLTRLIPSTGETFGITMTGVNKWTNAVGGFVNFEYAYLKVADENKFYIDFMGRFLIESSVQKMDALPIKKIIGVGRKM